MEGKYKTVYENWQYMEQDILIRMASDCAGFNRGQQVFGDGAWLLWSVRRSRGVDDGAMSAGLAGSPHPARKAFCFDPLAYSYLYLYLALGRKQAGKGERSGRADVIST